MQSCSHELLDRTLIWNERHLRHALHQYEQFYNAHQALGVQILRQGRQGRDLGIGRGLPDDGVLKMNAFK